MKDTVRAVAGRLEALRLTLATAESCTGGLVGATLTAVPGASAWYRGGLVVYSNDLKVRLAGVDPGVLEKEGAVSPAVARALARGARRQEVLNGFIYAQEFDNLCAQYEITPN